MNANSTLYIGWHWDLWTNIFLVVTLRKKWPERWIIIRTCSSFCTCVNSSTVVKSRSYRTHFVLVGTSRNPWGFLYVPYGIVGPWDVRTHCVLGGTYRNPWGFLCVPYGIEGPWDVRTHFVLVGMSRNPWGFLYVPYGTVGPWDIRIQGTYRNP